MDYSEQARSVRIRETEQGSHLTSGGRLWPRERAGRMSGDGGIGKGRNGGLEATRGAALVAEVDEEVAAAGGEEGVQVAVA